MNSLKKKRQEDPISSLHMNIFKICMKRKTTILYLNRYVPLSFSLSSGFVVVIVAIVIVVVVVVSLFFGVCLCLCMCLLASVRA